MGGDEVRQEQGRRLPKRAGAWRSFLNVKRLRISRSSMPEAARAYSLLSREDKAALQDMGGRAGLALRHSVNPYPSHSDAARRRRDRVFGPSERCVEDEPEVDISNEVDPTVRVKMQQRKDKAARREERAKHRAEQTEVLRQCQQIKDDLLAENHYLRDNRQGIYFGLIHSCPAMQISSALSKMTPTTVADLGSLKSLQKKWEASHIGVKPGKVDAAKKQAKRLCEQLGVCWCSRHMRPRHRMLVSITKGLKKLTSTFHLEEQLHSGTVVCLWTSATEVENRSARLWTPIPLHYRRPWRPTLVQMTEVDFDGAKVELRLAADQMETLLSSLDSLVLQFDISKQWHLTLGVLSSSSRVCGHFQGSVYATIDPQSRLCVWQGEEVEQRQARSRAWETPKQQEDGASAVEKPSQQMDSMSDEAALHHPSSMGSSAVFQRLPFDKSDSGSDSDVILELGLPHGEWEEEQEELPQVFADSQVAAFLELEEAHHENNL